MTDDTKPDHGEATMLARHVVDELHHGNRDITTVARAYLASQAENAKERERGNRLNARNGRMEHELSLLKPESAAKAAMETAYADMKSELATSQEHCKELEAALREGLPFLDEHVGCEIQESAPECYDATRHARRVLASGEGTPPTYCKYHKEGLGLCMHCHPPPGHVWDAEQECVVPAPGHDFSGRRIQEDE